MTDFIAEARLYLPSGFPEGSIIKIPVDMQTGKYATITRQAENPQVMYYCFYRTCQEWSFLGRGLTA